MPRKQRAPKARRGPAAPSLDLIDFLLQVSRTPEQIDRLHAAGISYDPFATFIWDQQSPEEFLTVWHQHEAVIVAECKRRGMAVPDPATYRPQTWVNYAAG